MKLRALIVDDEPLAQQYLVELLVATEQVEPVASVGTIAHAERALDALHVDTLFVDIRLVDRPRDASGLVWARSVLARPAAPMVVLATAMPDHALEGFDLGVTDYLVKPFTQQRVTTCVERLRTRAATRTPIEAPAPSRLLARTATALVFLPLDQIFAFEAADRLTYVHHATGRFLVDLSLTALEVQFASRTIRAHRNWLVAIDQVRELGRNETEQVLVVGDSLEVPVARDRASAVRDALTRSVVGLRR
ncbi:MAG: LytR/AlgR family response regulator transcription factor [Kofleriaceae bacterium]